MAGLLIKYLVKQNKTPILAVDADCNANLNEVLGLKLGNTLGNAREDMKKGDVPSGMTKDIFMEMKLEEAVVEAEGFDLGQDLGRRRAEPHHRSQVGPGLGHHQGRSEQRPAERLAQAIDAADVHARRRARPQVKGDEIGFSVIECAFQTTSKDRRRKRRRLRMSPCSVRIERP